MTVELEVLGDAASRLERAGVPYMITGSMALSYYAVPRMTRDIDIVIELEPGAGRRIGALFAPEYYVSDDDVEHAARERGMFNVLHLEKVVKIDFIVRKDTHYRREEFGRRRRIAVAGVETWVVTREDLILSKLEWAKDSGSELQLRDVRSLLAGEADLAYLRKWAAQITVAGLLQRCLDERHDA